MQADFSKQVEVIDSELTTTKLTVKAVAMKAMRLIMWRFCKTVLDRCLHYWHVAVHKTNELDLQDAMVLLSKEKAEELERVKEENELLIDEIEEKDRIKEHHAGALILRSFFRRFVRQITRRGLERWEKRYKDYQSAVLVESLLAETMAQTGVKPDVVL